MSALPDHEPDGPLLGGKYRLGKMLGRGGMGSVFEARHVRTGRSVAVKILHADYVGDAEVAARFLREARVVAELKHPNVVDVLDMDEEPDGTVYIVLELLEGESLGNLIRRKKSLPFERAAEVLVPVMRALALAHAHQIVHRDLKPENIFLHRDAEGEIVPKLLDFGIAGANLEESRPRITQTGYVMGTPEYMSPEQTLGLPDRIGAPSDVWSMGVLWYEALTGELPFTGTSPTTVMMAVTREKFARLSTLLPELPGAVTKAIDGALVRDVRHRYPDMGAFLDVLLDAMTPAEAPVESLPDLVTEPAIPAEETTEPDLVALREPRRMSPSGMVFASIAAACAGVAITVALLARGPAPASRAATQTSALLAAPRPAEAPVTPLAAAPPAADSPPPAAPPPDVIAVAPAAPERAPHAAAAQARSDEHLRRAAVLHPSVARPLRPATLAVSPAPAEAAPPPAPPRSALPRANAPLTDYDSLP